MEAVIKKKILFEMLIIYCLEVHLILEITPPMNRRSEGTKTFSIVIQNS
jgi:hypothetical protein